MQDFISKIAKTPKQRMIIWSLVTLFVLFILFSGSLFRQLGSKKVITVWGMNLNQDSFNFLTHSFQSGNSKVKIEYIEKNPDTYLEDLNNALITGTAPDVFMINNTWMNKFKNIITPLDLTKDKNYNLRKIEDEYPAIVKNDLIEENNLYGIPLSIDTLALYYNRNILDQAGIAFIPKTWEGLVSLLPKLRTVDQYKRIQRAAIPLGLVDNVNYASNILALLMLQKGAKIVDVSRMNIDIDNPIYTGMDNIIPGEEALIFYTQFAKPGSATYTWNSSLPNSIDAFAFGQSAFYIGYSTDKEKIESKNPNLNFGVEEIPQFDLNNKVNFASYYNFVVSKKASDTKISWDFIKYLMDDETQSKYLQITSFPPAKRKGISECGNDPILTIFCKNILTAKNYYQSDYLLYSKAFNDMINEVMIKNLTPRTAIKNAKDILQYALYNTK